MSDAAGRVADSTGNWVDTSAPAWSRPYLRLTRLDRPIGSWLLLLPCWWSAALAAIAAGWWGPDPWHVVLFLIGAIVDARRRLHLERPRRPRHRRPVERTRSRPIPSGQVSVERGAASSWWCRRWSGSLVLLQFNGFAIAAGIASLGVVAIYPFMKRVHLLAADLARPRVLLGRADGLGRGVRPARCCRRVCSIAGSIAWVIDYDTIYAHQDREDDALVGLKSTALLFGARTKPALALFSALAVVLIGAAGLTGRRRAACSRSGLPPSPRISPGRSHASTSPTRRSACGCSSRTATPD